MSFWSSHRRRKILWRRLQPVGVGWRTVDPAATNPHRLKPAPLKSSLIPGARSCRRTGLRHFARRFLALMQELEEFDAFASPPLHHFRIAQHSAEQREHLPWAEIEF